MVATLPLFSFGHELDASPECFGDLISSAEFADQPELLRSRLEEHGYLYLPGFLDPALVLAGRKSITDRLAAEGALDPSCPSIEGIRHPEKALGYRGDLAKDNPAIDRVVYGPELMSFYTRLFGEPARHFDHTWFRAISRGQGSPPHCDLVYMGRGTHELLTCWIPYGMIPLEVGGLIVLEDSHKKSARIKSYLEVDVDLYCENRPKDVEKVKIKGGWSRSGNLSNNPASLREKLGGRWLTVPEWKPGDFITFKMTLVHGSIDNQTDRVRLSSDTRYQPANLPADERWVGPNPAGHGVAGKRGRIC